MDLSIDSSFLLQIATFLILWACLKRFLFEPTLAVLDARQQRTSGARRDAEHMQSAAQAAGERCDTAIRDLRVQIAQESDVTRKAAQDDYARAVAQARAAAAEQLAGQRAGVAAQVDQARKTLTADAHSIAFEMVDRVAGRTTA